MPQRRIIGTSAGESTFDNYFSAGPEGHNHDGLNSRFIGVINTPFTPVAATGNFGSSTVVGTYCEINKVMCVRIRISVVTGGAFNLTGLAITVPNNRNTSENNFGQVRFYRNAVGEKYAPILVEGTKMYPLGDQLGTQLTGTSPIAGAGAWATGDIIIMNVVINFDS